MNLAFLQEMVPTRAGQGHAGLVLCQGIAGLGTAASPGTRSRPDRKGRLRCFDLDSRPVRTRLRWVPLHLPVSNATHPGTG